MNAGRHRKKMNCGKYKPPNKILQFFYSFISTFVKKFLPVAKAVTFSPEACAPPANWAAIFRTSKRFRQPKATLILFFKKRRLTPASARLYDPINVGVTEPFSFLTKPGCLLEYLYQTLKSIFDSAIFL